MLSVTLLGYIIVGLCWGVTNPFIKRATMTAAEGNTMDSNLRKSHFATLQQLFVNPMIFLPFLINQSGSLVYYFLLSQEPISKAAPICNSLTFIMTAITGYVFLKEEIKSPLLLIIGSILVLCGIYLCCN
jgi:drug/metabolite transporter (DMT)-like permease